MQLIAQPTSVLNGNATLPSSKSESIRGIIFGLLSGGECVLDNTLDSDDTQDAIRVSSQLGAKITRTADTLHITGCALPLISKVTTLNSGNSGITTRFILPVLGFRQNAAQPVVLDCGEQMRARPIEPLITALSNLGMQFQYLAKPGCCPVAVTGVLHGGKTAVGGLSSQYLTALLISLPCAAKDSEISVHNLHERPYIELTLHWLREQGIQFTHHQTHDTDVFQIKGQQKYQPFHKIISGDFSSASYLIAAAALAQGTVTLRGLDMQNSQGDKRLITILQQMGADIRIQPDQLVIHGGKPLHGMAIDANDIPDLLPTLAVVATQASGVSKIYNVKQARIKETDRIHSMMEGLTRMGAQIEEHEDGLTVHNSTLHGATVHGFDDHRTVMALAVAGMLAQQGETIISDANAINKTFPGFVMMMRSLGARLEVAR